jgi:hypothetical protein
VARQPFARSASGYARIVEVAAAFLLVIIIIAATIVGGGIYAITMWLRKRQLAPEGDKVEGAPGAPDRARRPEHVEVESEQKTRFAGTR